MSDALLDAHVRPPNWRSPSPSRRYDLVVIGGGTAGLVCAAGAAGLGARVALVERNRLGGDCLNTGCVPSKTLLAAAAQRMDFADAMSRVRATRRELAPNDSAARMTSLGVHVFFGSASFAGRDAVSIDDGVVLRFKHAVIATGSRPSVPAIPGLDDTRFLTTDTLFDVENRPGSLLVLGAGPVGCEIAQAYARLGAQVVLLERAPQILPNDDPDAACVLSAALAADGVRIVTDVNVTSAGMDTAGRVSVRLASGDSTSISGDALLVATGRRATFDGLNVEAADVQTSAHGVVVDDRLRTSNPRVFAAGDVCGGAQFTHAADAMARIVIQNALFHGRRRASELVIPSCTFTEPEVAHVGMSPADAARGGADTITVDLGDVDRAVIAGQTRGFVRVHHRSGRIAGATIVGPGAGELISIVVSLLQQKRTLADLSSAVFPYPTEALALKRVGDVYQRQRLKPWMRTALRYYFR
jgi:pyruvate/2-oxoglutarate dehydrogenase complex dihydrolipoamide dehydrogenase (E3) component